MATHKISSTLVGKQFDFLSLQCQFEVDIETLVSENMVNLILSNETYYDHVLKFWSKLTSSLYQNSEKGIGVVHVHCMA